MIDCRRVCPGSPLRTEPEDNSEFSPPLDAGIAKTVVVLRDAGVETFEACQGGPGHAYPEPTVRFHGNMAAGLHALAVVTKEGLPVAALRRVWPIQGGMPTGPWWELTFFGGTG